MPTRETPTHSPAPFALDRMGEVRDANGVVVATMSAANDADDRLILKSPDLLAACRAFVRGYSSKLTAPQTAYHAMRTLVDHIDGGGE